MVDIASIFRNDLSCIISLISSGVILGITMCVPPMLIFISYWVGSQSSSLSCLYALSTISLDRRISKKVRGSYLVLLLAAVNTWWC